MKEVLKVAMILGLGFCLSLVCQSWEDVNPHRITRIRFNGSNLHNLTQLIFSQNIMLFLIFFVTRAFPHFVGSH